MSGEIDSLGCVFGCYGGGIEVYDDMFVGEVWKCDVVVVGGG